MYKTQENERSLTSNKRTITLVFPPHWEPVEPYLALPSLTAYLRSKGLIVEQRDLNIEFYNEVLTTEYFEHIETSFSSLLKKKGVNPGKKSVLALNKTLIPYVKSQIGHAKKILRSSGLNLIEYEIAARWIQVARQIISAMYYPSEFTSTTYNTHHETKRLSGIIKASQNKSENIFRSFLRKKVQTLLLNGKTGLLGISLTSQSQLVPGVSLALIVKEANPYLPIVMGGAMLPYMLEAIKNTPEIFTFVDYFIIGEGETSLFMLWKHLFEGYDLEVVPNLIYKTKNGGVAETVQHIENINELPTPDFTDMPLSLYLGPETLPIQSSRGCYWSRCAFCSSCITKYRERRAELVIEDLKTLMLNHKVRHFSLSDLSTKPSRLSKICDLLQNHKLPGEIIYSIITRFEKDFSINLFKKAYTTGLRLIWWGLESGSSTILQKMNKGISLTVAEKCLENAHTSGIWNNLFIQFRFPGETDKDINSTTQFVLRNQDFVDMTVTGCFNLEGGSYIHKNPKEYGIERFKVPIDYIGPTYRYRELNSGKMRNVKNKPIDFQNMISSKHCCTDYYGGVHVSHLLRYLNNGYKGKGELRRQIYKRLAKLQECKNLANRVDELVLWIPGHVSMINITGMSEQMRNENIMMINEKTGMYFISYGAANKILSIIREPTTIASLIKQIEKTTLQYDHQIKEKIVSFCDLLIKCGCVSYEFLTCRS